MSGRGDEVGTAFVEEEVAVDAGFDKTETHCRIEFAEEMDFGCGRGAFEAEGFGGSPRSSPAGCALEVEEIFGSPKN